MDNSLAATTLCSQKLACLKKFIVLFLENSTAGTRSSWEPSTIFDIYFSMIYLFVLDDSFTS